MSRRNPPGLVQSFVSAFLGAAALIVLVLLAGALLIGAVS